MLRIGAALSAVALLALLPAGSAQAAPSKAKRCTPKGTKTVAENKYARVFTAEGQGPSEDEFVYRRLYGCMYSTGRRALLSVAYDDDYVTAGNFSNVRLNGRFVGWEYEAFEGSCKAGCPPDYNPLSWSVNSVDLRRPDDERGLNPRSDVTDLVVTRTGDLGWIEAGRVRAFVGGDVRELDPGPVRGDSLELTGYTASWDHAGKARSAELR